MKKSPIILLAIFTVVFVLAISFAQMPENDILKAFVSTNSLNSKAYISKLSSLANKRVNIIFESDSEQNLEELKNSFLENFPKAANAGQNMSVIDEVVDIYKNYPCNFLSEKTRTMIKAGDYQNIDNSSLERLYNPLGLYILPPDKDPYLLATDYVLANIESAPAESKEFEGKFYSLLHYEITDKTDIKNIVKASEKSDVSGFGKIYLTGVPVHSYFSALRSSIEVNVICIIATVAFILICFYYFKKPKVLIPITLNILFGLLCGLSVSILFFKKIHILTFVFSTSLIGISLDYSLHYILSGSEKGFKKSLLMSLCSTVLAFTLLYFSNIEVLKQISVFTCFGLTGVYLFVLIILPLFKIPAYEIDFSEPPVKKYKKQVLALVLSVVCFGLINLKFCDDLKSLYQPKGKLLAAEIAYNKIFDVPKIGFLLTKGDSLDNALENEEKISANLFANNIKYIALSNFVSSMNKQKENQLLVQELYKNNLNTYADFLALPTKQKLLTNQNRNLFNPENFPLAESFTIDKNTLFMLVENPPSSLKIINIQDDMTDVIKSFRKKCLKIIPLIFVGIYSIIAVFLNKKTALKLVVPSLLGGLFPIGILSALNVPINVFHLLAFILVIGFSLDYSIFRHNNTQSSGTGVFISALTSTISFALLGFVGFKVISSLGIVLAVGIFTSYVLSLIVVNPCSSDDK